LAEYVFEFNLPIPWIVILYGGVFGVLACVLGGLWLQRKISRAAASEVLRGV
jgi:ABC-type antimicrobial peptide transport system permease subunit